MSKKRRNRRIQSTKSAPVVDAQSSTPAGALPLGLSVNAMDAYTNALARLGSGQGNLMEGSDYTLTGITRNVMLLNTLYREDWIAKRIIDAVAEDMTRKWYRITSNLKAEEMEAISALERKTKVRERITKGLKWARLYGGAAAIILIDGHEDFLHIPLDLDTVMPGSFKGLLVLDRWCGIYPDTSTLIDDLGDPDFGLPAYYYITSQSQAMNSLTRTGVRVHHSRVLRFPGRELPTDMQINESYWGASELEHVYEELTKRNATSANIAQLVFQANLRIFKMGNFGQMLATKSEKALQMVYNTIEAQNTLMSNSAVQIMDKEDNFESHAYTFTGLDAVYDKFMLDVAGAAEMPVTKLFGRSPAGMNATGEADETNYYDSIKQKQETYVDPVLEKLLPIMSVSAIGYVPPDLSHQFNDMRTATDQEKADLIDKNAQSVDRVYNSGIIDRATSLRELRNSGNSTGMWTSITDEMIEAAEHEFIGGEVDFPVEPAFTDTSPAEEKKGPLQNLLDRYRKSG